MPRLTGLLSRAVTSFPRWVVKATSAARTADGVIEFHARRYMIDYGHYAVLHAGGQEWGGRSGRSLASLLARKDAHPVPFWLLDLLDGVSAASEADHQEVRGAPCRRFTANVDGGHASVVLPSSWLDDPGGLQLEVWVDQNDVRRISLHADHRTQTPELWDIGQRVDDLDWTHLPTFRSSE
jgi:hypothetical protein